MLLKLRFWEKEKAKFSVVTGFFSNIAWFAIDMTWKKNKTGLSIYDIDVLVIVAKPSIALTRSLF